MQHLFDAHLDMAWNALEWNRDLMRPVSEIRAFERQFGKVEPGENTVSWVELRRGRVATVIVTLLPRLRRKDKPLTFYQSREAAYGACRGQLAYYRAMTARGELREIADRQTLERHVAEWDAAPTADGLPLGFILSMEGSWGVLSPGQIEEWYRAGLRILGPAHYGPDPYGHGTGSEGGLKADGPALLREMERVGMLLDVTHLSDQSFWEALDVYGGPVLASHHNCRALVPGDRQLTDEQIRAVAARGGVIGASFDCWMIKPDWKIGVSDPQTVSLEDIADHTDHICQLVGSARHCGIGSDLDGGFGKEQTPHDLDTIAELEKFGDILAHRGYSPEDVEAILCRNWIDFFLRVWAHS